MRTLINCLLQKTNVVRQSTHHRKEEEEEEEKEEEEEEEEEENPLRYVSFFERYVILDTDECLKKRKKLDRPVQPVFPL